MNVELFSNKYVVRTLNDENLDEIYKLLSKNVLYYEYCPPFVTRQGILDDMNALPPETTMKDKYYIGFYQNDKLIAVMDFIDGYPEKEIAYIGFFMTDVSMQNRGLGTEIIDYLCEYLVGLEYHSIRLAYVKGNSQAEHFWLKNRFEPIMETKSNVSDKVILAERLLYNKSTSFDRELKGEK